MDKRLPGAIRHELSGFSHALALRTKISRSVCPSTPVLVCRTVTVLGYYGMMLGTPCTSLRSTRSSLRDLGVLGTVP